MDDQIADHLRRKGASKTALFGACYLRKVKYSKMSSRHDIKTR